MSKRFGRNQKRRMRAELASISSERAKLEMDYKYLCNGHSALEREIHVLNEEMSEAREYVGRLSAIFPQEAWDYSKIEPRQTMQIDVTPRVNEFVSEDSAILDAVVRREPLIMLLSRLDEDKFREQMHVDVEFAGGRWAYGITRQALHDMPTRVLIRRVSDVLSRQIAIDLGKRGLHRT